MTVLKSKDSLFFSTRKSEGIYSYIINSAKKHAEDDLKKKLQLFEYSHNKRVSLKIIFNLFKIFFATSFFNTKKLVKYKFLGSEIGRHVVATCYTDYRSHFNQLFFFYKKVVYLFSALNLLHEIKDKEKFISAVYLDHGMFLNGIIVNYFSNKKKIIYSNNYPRGLFYKPIKSNKFLTYENFLGIRYNKNSNYKKKKLINKILNKNTKNPSNFYPWMKQKMFKRFSHDSFGKIDYIVYCHAFTDAQLQFGYDDFITIEEWLRFTLNILKVKKSKVIVKAHPNFNKYNKIFRSKLEIKIFNKIMNEYKDDKNILFLSDPVRNIDILKKVDNKKTILVTHHGTTILEGTNLNFKFISFEKNFWSKKFKLTNTWKDKIQYKNLLNKKFASLDYPNKRDLYSLCDQIFLNDKGFAGKNYYVNILSSRFNLNKENIINGKIKLENYNPNNKLHGNLINTLLKSIETIAK
tara:strand:- start:938 stop:2329 length:1392 start_codon:yes stop_codon:yes gene_type:complete